MLLLIFTLHPFAVELAACVFNVLLGSGGGSQHLPTPVPLFLLLYLRSFSWMIFAPSLPFKLSTASYFIRSYFMMHVTRMPIANFRD